MQVILLTFLGSVFWKMKLDGFQLPQFVMVAGAEGD